VATAAHANFFSMMSPRFFETGYAEPPIIIVALSLLAILVCLLAQHAYPPAPRQPLMEFYGRMCLSAAKRLNAGDRNSGIVAWIAVVAAVMIPAALVTALAAAIHPLAVWLLDVAMLYGSLRFLATLASLRSIEKGLREGDTAGAANQLAQWQGEPLESGDAGAIARLAAEHALRESITAHSRCFSGSSSCRARSASSSIRSRCASRRAGSTWSRATSATSAGSRRAPSRRSTGSRSA
jgi:hypothetical protein